MTFIEVTLYVPVADKPFIHDTYFISFIYMLLSVVISLPFYR